MVGSGVNDNAMEAIGANLPHRCISAGEKVMMALVVAGEDDAVVDPPRILFTSFRLITDGVFGVTRNPLHTVKRYVKIHIQYNMFLFLFLFAIMFCSESFILQNILPGSYGIYSRLKNLTNDDYFPIINLLSTRIYLRTYVYT